MFDWLRRQETLFRIYFIVGIFSVITFFYWFIYRTSLSENLFAGTIDLIVTVFVINRLIIADRVKRLIRINKFSSDWVSTYAGICLMKFAGKIKYKIDDFHKEAELPYQESMKLVDNIFASEEFKTWYSKITKYDKPAISILKKFIKDDIDGNKKIINDALEKLKPYPNPEVTEHLFQNDVNTQALVMVVIELISGIYEIGKKHPGDTSATRELITSLIDEGPTKKKIDHDIRTYYQNIILLKKYHEEGKLYFDL